MAGSKGAALAAVGAGTLFLYAGIKNVSVLKSLQNLIRGQAPGTGQAPQAGTAPGAGGAIVTNIPAGQGAYPSSQAIAKLWTDNGGPADTAAFAGAVGMAESGGSATVTSSNPDGGTNVGVFQLDTRGVGSGYSVAELQDPNLNTQVTIMATNGGTDWTEWGDPVTAAVGYHYVPGSPVP